MAPTGYLSSGSCGTGDSDSASTTHSCRRAERDMALRRPCRRCRSVRRKPQMRTSAGLFNCRFDSAEPATAPSRVSSDPDGFAATNLLSRN
eukprot:scaffold6285_cov121-Isochrysis_galbana.AAC.9